MDAFVVRQVLAKKRRERAYSQTREVEKNGSARDQTGEVKGDDGGAFVIRDI